MDGKNRTQKVEKQSNMILWVLGFFLIVGGIFTAFGSLVVKIDPFFHYHKPDTTQYYYELDSERNQNNGIATHFDYDAMIIGTSMAQNFKTSEFDELFDVHSVKIPLPGASFRELGDQTKRALESNSKIKIVLRSLDMDFFFMDYDDYGTMATGDYPTYLYDKNPLNDYRYLLNRDVIFGRVYSILKATKEADFEPGITDFDSYSNWMGPFIGKFGVNSVCATPLENSELTPSQLTNDDKNQIKRSVTYNILQLASDYPDVEFYYYMTPYSVAWWNSVIKSGNLGRQIQAEQYIIQLMLEYDNIHLYSFNTNIGLTADLNNYKDMGHYGEWVNSAILRWINKDTGLLTEDNFLTYIREEYMTYANFDFTTVNGQIDYEDDFEATAKLMDVKYDKDRLEQCDIRHAKIVENLIDDAAGIKCTGTLTRSPEDKRDFEDYLYKVDYNGVKLEVEELGRYQKLSFMGRKDAGTGMPVVVIYDKSGTVLTEFMYSYAYLDNDWHEYTLDISSLRGTGTIILHGAYTDNTGKENSSYTFCDITLE